MNASKQLLKIIKSINGHPLAGRHRWLGYYNLVRWQIRSRLMDNYVNIRFTEKSRLWVRKGMTGATGNIYMGLHDFPEMAFLLHFLREKDLFMDIGANVGTYTVLASAHVGCRSIAFEPVSTTFQALLANVELNMVKDRVTAVNAAVGAAPGEIIITAFLDTVNHVVHESASLGQNLIQVQLVTADKMAEDCGVPALVKIDVEGFELEVLQGMQGMLLNNALKAIIIELNGSGERYGYSDKMIHEHLLNRGFYPFTYDPFRRELAATTTHGQYNTLYIRDPERVRERLRTAPSITIFRETF